MNRETELTISRSHRPMPDSTKPDGAPVGAVLIDNLAASSLKIGFDGYSHGPQEPDGKAFPIEIYFLNGVPNIRIWKNPRDIGPTFNISFERDYVS